MPAAGGFSQTAINQGAGARTQLSELVTVALAVGCALFLGGVLSDLPQATLGCMVVLAVLGLIDPGAFVEFWQVSRIEFWIAVVTAASGLALGLLPAVLIGVLLTLFLVLVELDRMGLTELQPTRDERDVEPAGPGTEAVPGLIILRFDGPLYTANVRSANRKILAAVDDRPGTRVLVLDATAVALVTVTLINEFSVLERELHQRGVTLWVTALPPAARRAAEQRPRWAELAQADRLHPTARSAVESYRAGRGRC